MPSAKGLKEGRGCFSAATRGKAFWEEGMETGGGRVVGAEGRVQGEEEEWSEGTGPERGGEKPQRLRLLLGQNQVASPIPRGGVLGDSQGT